MRLAIGTPSPANTSSTDASTNTRNRTSAPAGSPTGAVYSLSGVSMRSCPSAVE